MSNPLEGISTFGVITSAKSSYLRNNKSGGCKHLRCFPHCLEHGHVANGFCGAPLYSDLVLNNEKMTQHNFVAVAQFVLFEPETSGNDISNRTRGDRNTTTTTTTTTTPTLADTTVVANKSEKKPTTRGSSSSTTTTSSRKKKNLPSDPFSPISGEEYPAEYLSSRINSRTNPLSPLYESNVVEEPWNDKNAHLIFKFEPSS